MRQRIQFCLGHDGARIAWAVSGSGPPLVKVANWLSHLEFDWHSPVWRHWLDEFSRERSLVRFDSRGCGLSDWRVADFSLDARVGDLEAVVEAAGLRRFPMLALSQGVPVAIAYATRHPERVSRLVLYGGYLRGRLRRAPPDRSRAEAEALLGAMRVGWGQDNPAFRQLFTTLFIPDASPEQARWFNELQRLSTSPEIAARLAHASYELDAVALAPRVTVPTLVLHATGDASVPFDLGREVSAAIPSARFVPLESRNHILLADEPAWARFVAEVNAFLDEDPAGARTPGAERLAGLTGRERQVLDLIARGRNNDAIATALFISPKTVRNHITSIFDKLGVADRAEAIVLARDAGLGRRD